MTTEELRKLLVGMQTQATVLERVMGKKVKEEGPGMAGCYMRIQADLTATIRNLNSALFQLERD